MRSVDQFGQRFVMKLDGSTIYYDSYMGMFLTFITAVAISMFGFSKFMTIMNKNEVNIMSAI